MEIPEYRGHQARPRVGPDRLLVDVKTKGTNDAIYRVYRRKSPDSRLILADEYCTHRDEDVPYPSDHILVRVGVAYDKGEVRLNGCIRRRG